jgi:Spy/CpxP family protein refolding chaperone
MKSLLTAISVALLALVIGAGLAGAQPAGPGAGEKAPQAKKCMKHARCLMAEKLGLTDAQKEQVKTILKAAREEAKTATDRAAKIQIFKDAREKIRTTVLTDEQRTKLDEMKAKWRENHKGGAVAPGAGQGVQASPPVGA